MNGRYSDGDTGVTPDRGSTTRIPRWVKVFGLIAMLVILLVIILHLQHLIGGGFDHHYTSPSSATEQVYRP
jgi:hypothetical protein